MTIEALAGEIGFVSTRDVQDTSTDATVILLLVLRHGAPPIRQRIALGAIPGGRGAHRGLICPLCSQPKYRLFASTSGLGCGPCTRRRSRRQLEHRSHRWRRLGGELEDIVLRGLRSGRRSSTVLDLVTDAAVRLMADDRERVDVLLRRAETALKVATTPTVGVRDVLDQEEQ